MIYDCWGRLGARFELAGIVDGPSQVGGAFSSMRHCEVGGGADVVEHPKELIRMDNREAISECHQKHKKTMYLTPLATNRALTSIFAFFPLPCPLLYGSVCVILCLVFALAPITLTVSDHEPWLGVTFFGFSKTCGCADPAKRRSRRQSNCCRQLDLCCGGESWVRTASLCSFDGIWAKSAKSGFGSVSTASAM